jgi:hypothetical protein
VKEVLVAKLKLLCERVLIQSLATLKLLAGEEMDLLTSAKVEVSAWPMGD